MVKKVQLPLQTLSLVVSFMAWVLISSLISYISQDIPLTAGQRAWSTAIPVILGSLLRIPAGFLTQRFGARWMNTISFLILLAPVYLLKQVYGNEKLWFFSIFYFITFGSFVAFTIYLPGFLASYFELSKVDAGLRTAGFIALATFLRPVGGILSVAYEYRTTIGPWFRSLFTFQPQYWLMDTVPFVFQLHIVLAFLLFASIPFTHLVHMFSLPVRYPARAPQQYRSRNGYRRRERT
ncbi:MULTISPECIES: respiratory nitrate reductase subunit gamma [Paenibacillus]|uniref:respiratory nitrate reductase subunit gamma n=1 Tax=Paenibacillus TaxID=44249 RepID=UPI002FE0435F